MCSRLNQAMPRFGGEQSEREREERQRTVRMGQERGRQASLLREDHERGRK